MTLVDLGFGDQVAERKTLFSLLAADCHKLAKSLLLSLCCYSLCLRQCHHDHHPHDHHHHPPARHHLLHHLIKQMLLFVCRLFFWLALRATNSPTALMPNSFFTPTMSTEIARTLPSWKIWQNICLWCKANIFARALVKIVQGKTDSASCRIPMSLVSSIFLGPSPSWYSQLVEKRIAYTQWHYALHWLQNQAQLPPQSVLE